MTVDLNELAAMEAKANRTAPTPFKWSQHLDITDEFVAWVADANGRAVDMHGNDADEFYMTLRNAASWLIERARRAEELERRIHEIAVDTQPDYPNVKTIDAWQQLWAIHEGFKGTDLAVIDCHAKIVALEAEIARFKNK